MKVHEAVEKIMQQVEAYDDGVLTHASLKEAIGHVVIEYGDAVRHEGDLDDDDDLEYEIEFDPEDGDEEDDLDDFRKET